MTVGPRLVDDSVFDLRDTTHCNSRRIQALVCEPDTVLPLIGMIERGEPLPAEYRRLLFAGGGVDAN